MKATDTDNPGKVIGNTWAQIQGKFLLGASSSYAIKSTGGETTHTLTVDEMPSHFHPMYNLYYLSYNVTQGNEGHCSNWSSHFSGMANTNNVGGGNLTTICHLIKLLLFGREQLSLPFGGVVA